MKSVEIRKAAAELRSIWTIGNEYLQVSAPWTQFKKDPDRAACIIKFSFNLIALFSNISKPFIPNTAEKIDKALNLKDNISWPESLQKSLLYIQEGHTFAVPENLFEKLSDEKVNELKQRFSGNIEKN